MCMIAVFSNQKSMPLLSTARFQIKLNPICLISIVWTYMGIFFRGGYFLDRSRGKRSQDNAPVRKSKMIG